MPNIKLFLKKLITTLIIITIMMSQLAVVGETIVSFAIEAIQTNNENVIILAYFENEQGEKISEERIEIDKTLTLKVDVTVKNDQGYGGYFDGKIKLRNEEIDVHINAGETKTIQKEIMYEDLVDEEIEAVLNGKYVNSKKEYDIEGSSKVLVKWLSKEKTEAEIKAEVLTNKTYTVNEQEKNILQIMVEAKVKNDSYPIKDTQIEIEFPEEALQTKIDEQTTIKEGTHISIFTFESEDSTSINNVRCNVKLTLFDDKELTSNAEIIINGEKDGRVTGTICEEEKDIFKGKLYVQETREYVSTTNINVNYVPAVEKISAQEQRTKYITVDAEEKIANIEYINSKINKSIFQELFGEDGFLLIEDQDGNRVANITNESEADEEGYIVVTYGEGVTSIKIETSKPSVNGTLSIINNKVIKDKLKREEVEKLEKIKETVEVNGKNEEEYIYLKETETVATIELENDTISTISKEEQILKMRVKLDTSDESKELYKNPKVKITLPEEIKNTEVKSIKPICANGLQIEKVKTEKNENGNIEIEAIFSGEQNKYDTLEGDNLQIDGGTELVIEVQVEADKLTPSKESKIKLSYTNENKNVNKETETAVKFESHYGLMIYNEISNYDASGNKIDGINDEEISAVLDAKSEKRQAEVKTILINNYENEIKELEFNTQLVDDESTINLNLKDAEETIESILPGESIEILSQVDIPENVEYNQLARITQNINYKYLNNDFSKTANIELKTDEKILMKTAAAETARNEDTTMKVSQNGIETNIKVISGDIDLKDTDSIFEGQTIKYIVTIKNNSGKDYKNVNIKAVQSNGKVWNYAERKQISASVEGEFYEHFYEVTDSNNIELATIENFQKGETKTYEYEAVPNILSNGGHTTWGMINITSQDGLDISIKSIENEVKKSDLKVTVEDAISREYKWSEKEKVEACIKVQNLSENMISNIQLKIAFSSNLIADGNQYFSYGSYANRIQFEKAEKNASGETIVTLNIVAIGKNEVITFYARPITNLINGENSSDNIWIISEAITNGQECFSNKYTRSYYKTRNGISVETQGFNSNDEKINENTIINNNDNITIVTKVSNNEDKNIEIQVTDSMPDGLSIQKVTLIENKIEKDITNEASTNKILNYKKDIDAKSSIELKINVKINAEQVSSEIVSNTLKVKDNEYTNIYPFEFKFKVNKENKESEEQENDDISQSVYAIEKERNEFGIKGTAWIDINKNGKREDDEEKIKGMIVKAIDTEKVKILDIDIKTAEDGSYSLTLEKGKYILIYMYDSEKYNVTTYQADNIEDYRNSDVVARTIKVNGKETYIGATDILNLDRDLENIDIGIYEKKNFDMKLEKFIEQIVVTNSNGTKKYTFDKEEQFAKVEIPAKVLNGSNVVITYNFRITNVGDIEGYVSNIVDYLPKSLTFNPGANKDWYQSGEYIYNASLADTLIRPNEVKEIHLTVTKTMTNSNTELVENRAEIEESKNSYGAIDKTEDNAKAEILIGIRTGSTLGFITTTITIIIVICGITHFINRRYFDKRIRV